MMPMHSRYHVRLQVPLTMLIMLFRYFDHAKSVHHNEFAHAVHLYRHMCYEYVCVCIYNTKHARICMYVCVRVCVYMCARVFIVKERERNSWMSGEACMPLCICVFVCMYHDVSMYVYLRIKRQEMLDVFPQLCALIHACVSLYVCWCVGQCACDFTFAESDKKSLMS
jgi:hypothetical protein